MFKKPTNKLIICFISILVFSPMLKAQSPLVFSPVLKTQSPDRLNQSTFLIVMLKGELNGEKTIGAGIIIGKDKDQVYIVTANHVVRKGTSAVQNLKVLFRHQPEQFIDAELLPDVDKGLDIAILRVNGFSTLGVDFCRLPLTRLGNMNTLKRGTKVFPVGYPNGALWGMPVAPDLLAQIVGNEITFQSNFISAGHSGGGLLTEQGELIGMLRSDQPPFGGAIVFEKLEQIIKGWGYPMQLRIPKPNSRTPLHTAVEQGDITEVKRLIDNCLDVSANDRDGKGPIHIAAEQGSSEMVKILVDAGAYVSHLYYYSKSYTPLEYAIKTDDIEIVRILLKNGARPFADRNVTHPLNVATQYASISVIKLLLAAGADINIEDAKERTPLYFAVKKGDIKLVRLFLSHGAHPKTAIYAVSQNQVKILNLLLEFDNDVRMGVAFTYTDTLNLAIENGNIEMITVLLTHGLDPNLWSYGGRFKKGRPIMNAIETGNLAIVKLLLKYGANIEVKSMYAGYKGQELQFAIKKGHSDIIKLLRDQVESETATKSNLQPLKSSYHREGSFNKKYIPSWLGVRFQRSDWGAQIVSVHSRSQAKKAGLKIGDIIFEYNNQFINKANELSRLVKSTPVKKEIAIKLLRKGRPLTINVKRQAGGDFWSAVSTGAVKGALITEIKSDSPAKKADLREGDIIVEYNQIRINIFDRLEQMIKSTPAGNKVTIKLFREGQFSNVEVLIGKHPDGN